jgi:DUF4097 and DUF4098 domain-containing protein YvlB
MKGEHSMEEKKRILNMVKEGKLTVEEALMLLEQLDQKKSDNGFSSSSYTSGPHADAKPHSFNMTSLKEKLLDVLDIAVKKVKEFDFQFANAFAVKHVFQQSAAALQEIDVYIANGHIKMVPWDQADVRVECDVKVYRSESADAARRAFTEEAVFFVRDGCLRFSVSKPFMKTDAVIYIPKTSIQDAKFRLLNGNINIEDVHMDKLHIKNVNGSMMLHRLAGKEAELETGNGSIVLDRSAFEEVEAETIHGEIKLDGHYRYARLRTFGGGITYATEREDGVVTGKTVTGNITLLLPRDICLEGEMRTNLGGLVCRHPNALVAEEKQETAQKIIRFQCKNEAKPPFHIYADSKAGSISLYMAGGGDK